MLNFPVEFLEFEHILIFNNETKEILLKAWDESPTDDSENMRIASVKNPKELDKLLGSFPTSFVKKNKKWHLLGYKSNSSKSIPLLMDIIWKLASLNFDLTIEELKNLPWRKV